MLEMSAHVQSLASTETASQMEGQGALLGEGPVQKGGRDNATLLPFFASCSRSA